MECVRFACGLFYFKEDSMKNKHPYISPELDIFKLQFDDIIRTSGNGDSTTDDDLDKDIGEWDDEM